jgi:5-methylcytosine-specific restriction endonuclease McrA
MRARVRALLDEGLNQREIADRLGVGKTTVNYHARRLDVPIETRFGKRYDWEAIRSAYEGGLSRKQCMARFGFSADAWYKAVKRGAIVPRPKAMPIEELLVAGRTITNRTHLKHRLLNEGLKENRCEICGITRWMGQPVNMQLHHKNGDGSDNRLENIQFLCGTCHSQTDTYGGRNGYRKPDRHLRLVEPPEEGEAAESA